MDIGLKDADGILVDDAGDAGSAGTGDIGGMGCADGRVEIAGLGGDSSVEGGVEEDSIVGRLLDLFSLPLLVETVSLVVGVSGRTLLVLGFVGFPSDSLGFTVSVDIELVRLTRFSTLELSSVCFSGTDVGCNVVALRA
ncbi:hypothetical protein [Bartonella gliris]|uniref:hypothetical protein n=1 Tax=Bartonella gliris TaxID=3004109 RepID=UPI003872F2DF